MTTTHPTYEDWLAAGTAEPHFVPYPHEEEHDTGIQPDDLHFDVGNAVTNVILVTDRQGYAALRVTEVDGTVQEHVLREPPKQELRRTRLNVPRDAF